MASAAVSVDDLERGDVPALCAKTGVPCSNPVRLRFRVRASGPLGFLRTEQRLFGTLAIAPGRARVLRRLGELSWLALAALVAGVVWAFAKGGPPAGLLAGGGLVAYVALVLAGSLASVGATASADPGTVVLTRVHPEFARAVEAEPTASH